MEYRRAKIEGGTFEILCFGRVASNTRNCEGYIFWLSLKIFLLNNVWFSLHLLGSTSFHPTYEGLRSHSEISLPNTDYIGQPSAIPTPMMVTIAQPLPSPTATAAVP
ncbi:MAG: hypothetical protein QNJ63_30760 [Calothrix sp. MO_192.B10]|nr:hypothetical protein [Calothrix sp. MO_192.B10]